MAGHINTFIGGMDKDTSKQKYANSKYVDANNLRPLTDEGLSSGALENIAGNKLAIDFPEIEGVSVIDITSLATDENNTTKTITNFKIDTGYLQTTVIIPSISFTTATDLVEQLSSYLKEKNASLPVQLQYKVGILESIDRVVVYNFATPVLSISGNIYMDIEIYNKHRDFIVIGSAELRDDIVLFTKNQTGPTDFGQIWRLTYDVARPNNPNYYSLELIYTGKLNFSLEHPIKAKAVYENTDIQRTYWSDYNETLRGCNLQDPSTFAFRAQEFALTPQTELSPAIGGRKNHLSGNLDSGIWYVTYRLSRLGGGVTGVAPFSAGIPVIVDDPSVGVGGNDTDYHLTNYTVTSVPTTKSIDFSIFDIPKGHDQITIYAVNETDPGNQIAYLYGEYFLSDNPDFNFTISDTSTKQVIPFTSLVDINVEFDKVKDLTIKDNALLVANCSLASFDIDFDARAYRFRNNANQETYVGIGTNNALTPTQLADPNWGLNLELDVVNPLNNDKSIKKLLESGSTEEQVYYAFQIDGVTRGGTGPNLSYEFVSTRFTLDDSEKALPVHPNVDVGYNHRAPYVNNIAEDNILMDVNGQSIDIGPGFPNFKNPTFEAHFKGYMRDEVYRFGIVFYSKTGKPSEVKWIADIRFPAAGDVETDETGFDNFSLCQYTKGTAGYYLDKATANGAKIPGTTTGATYGNTIGIKFDVDISTVRDDISGYSIVRAPRKEKDRTIIAEGVLHTVDEVAEDIGVFGTSAGLGNTLFSGRWKEEAITKGDLFIKDSIKPLSEKHESKVVNTLYKSRNPNWAYGTLDCPDLKLITGARLNGFKNRGTSGTDTTDNYKLKPVSLYAGTNPRSVSNDIKDLGRIYDSYSLDPSLPVDTGEDIYTKSTTLINSASAIERYSAAWDWGNLKDIFYVDHGNGGDSYAKIDNLAEEEVKFFNAGINDVVGKGSNLYRAFGGIGTRTILFQGHDANITKRLINTAGKTLNLSDPYEADGTSFNNDLNSFSYLPATLKTPTQGMYAIVDIYRHLENQYGGDTYLARQETEYITTGNFTKVNSATSGTDIISTGKVYGGDIVTSLWTEKKFYTYERDNTPTWAGRQDVDVRTRLGGIRGMIVPLQTIANTELRPLINFNNYNSEEVSATDIEIHRKNPDEYAIPVVYHKEKDVQSYLVEGAGSSLITEYDNRVYMSNTKSNGELIDNWAIFESHNFKDVNGEYGPINALETFNDNVVFFQDKAFGTLAVNPRSVIQDTGGNDLTFGTGGGIVDFNYVSNSVGTSHQWGIQKTQSGIYFFDSLHKKLFAFTGQNTPLSDLKGMSSWFYNKIKGDMISKDNPILFEGMTTAYDHRFNEVIFTFHFYSDENELPEVSGTLEDIRAGLTLNPVTTEISTKSTTYPETLTRIWYDPSGVSGWYKIAMTSTQLADIKALILNNSRLYMTLPDGSYVEVTLNSTYETGYVYVASPAFTAWDAELSPSIDNLPIYFKTQTPEIATATADIINVKPLSPITDVTATDSITTPLVDAFPNPDKRISFTLVYNELTQAFTSFYSHWPRHYFTNGRRIFSQDPAGYGIYVHDEGNRGQFYGELYDSDIELLVNPQGTHAKVFNNFEFNSQVYDIDGVNLTQTTIDRARFFNEYQDSQTIALVPDSNIKRRMRTWRLQVPRDSDTRGSRIRNPYMGTTLSFTNTGNRRIVLHDTITYYMDTPM
jgi:hypothetical protein